MAESERGPLAELVEASMRERNLTPHQIRANGGPAENTLWLIRNGTTRQPTPATLASLARAFATHPYSKRLDISIMNAIHHALRLAAGYGEPEGPTAEGLLELALLDALGDFALAQLWARFIREQGACDLAALTDGMAAFRAAAERRCSIE